MAHIRKRTNGTYQAAVYLGKTDGKQDFEYITCDTWHETKKLSSKRELEIKEGKYTSIPAVRFKTWAIDWLELNRNSLSPSTVSLYSTYINVHYIPFFKDMKLGKINEIQIRRFINEKLATLKSGTVRKLFFVLSRILSDALKKDNPCQYITAPAKDDFKPYVLTDKEFQSIHDAFKGTQYEPIVLLAGWCGLRRGEIFALKADDIDWKNHIIRVDESRCITDEGIYIDKLPKSKNGVREIPAPEYLIKLLLPLRFKQSYLFEGRPDNFSSAWARLRIKNKLPPIRFHDLRHYHASWLYDNNIPDQYAADRLGHDVQILKAIYQHMRKDKSKLLDKKILRIQKKSTQ